MAGAPNGAQEARGVVGKPSSGAGQATALLALRNCLPAGDALTIVARGKAKKDQAHPA
jgi:hypothetical protein